MTFSVFEIMLCYVMHGKTKQRIAQSVGFHFFRSKPTLFVSPTGWSQEDRPNTFAGQHLTNDRPPQKSEYMPLLLRTTGTNKYVLRKFVLAAFYQTTISRFAQMLQCDGTGRNIRKTACSDFAQITSVFLTWREKHCYASLASKSSLFNSYGQFLIDQIPYKHCVLTDGEHFAQNPICSLQFWELISEMWYTWGRIAHTKNHEWLFFVLCRNSWAFS